jgi:hypothetical protein
VTHRSHYDLQTMGSTWGRTRSWRCYFISDVILKSSGAMNAPSNSQQKLICTDIDCIFMYIVSAKRQHRHSLPNIHL